MLSGGLKQLLNLKIKIRTIFTCITTANSPCKLKNMLFPPCNSPPYLRRCKGQMLRNVASSHKQNMQHRLRTLYISKNITIALGRVCNQRLVVEHPPLHWVCKGQCCFARLGLEALELPNPDQTRKCNTKIVRKYAGKDSGTVLGWPWSSHYDLHDSLEHPG